MDDVEGPEGVGGVDAVLVDVVRFLSFPATLERALGKLSEMTGKFGPLISHYKLILTEPYLNLSSLFHMQAWNCQWLSYRLE